jgi:hypothetical protein
MKMTAPPANPQWMMSMGSAGTAFAGPWGISYAHNLTPDSTGLGSWTENDFITALRTGQHHGAQPRPIMPPMPWPAFKNMTDDDLKSIYAYLKTIPAIHNQAPDPTPPSGGAAMMPPGGGAPKGPDTAAKAGQDTGKKM